MRMIINKGKRSVRILAVALALALVATAGLCPTEVSAASFTKTKVKGLTVTAVDRDIAVTWEPQSGAKGYYVYESVNGGKFKKVETVEDGHKVILTGKVRGRKYGYRVKAFKKNILGKIKTGKMSAKRYTTVAPYGKSTIKNLLSSSLAPVGSTMYIWGGTWRKSQKPDKKDDATGKYGNNTGTAKEWRTYAAKQDSSYSWYNTRYKIHKGMDCAGYVGWAVYQVMNTEDNKLGYVTFADEQGEVFAKRKLGGWTKASKVHTHQAGDIMSGPEHIYMVVGECKDGSLVILHASPPGVKLSGTYSSDGVKNSQAAKLAKKYMKKYFKSWYKRYPEKTLRYGGSYLRDYGRFRWYDSVLSDPDGYRNMSAEQVLKDLFGER